MIIRLPFLGAFTATTLLLTAFHASAKDSRPLTAASYNMIQAAIAERIRDEFSSQMLDQKLKTAMLNSANPEDKVELTRLMASYKPSKNHSFEAIGTSLRMLDKKGNTVFTITPPAMGKNEFTLNGQAWTMPESGSILQDLRRHLNPNDKSPKKSGAKLNGPLWKLLSELPTTLNASDSSTATLPIYYLVRTGNQKSVVSLHEMIDSVNLSEPLVHGPNEESGPGAIMKSIMQSIYWAVPYDVQCTAKGAKGFAKVGGTEVEFLVGMDESVQIKSKTNPRVMLFNSLGNAEPKKYLEKIETLGKSLEATATPDQKNDPIRGAHQRLYDVAANLCVHAKSLPRDTTGVLDSCGWLNKQDDGTFMASNFASKYKPKDFAKFMKEWYGEHKFQILELAEKVDQLRSFPDITQRIQACTDDTCTKFHPEKTFESYRIPPNETPSAVREALSFNSSSVPEAKIEYNCQTKDSACQSVTLRNGEQLSGKELDHAKKLVKAANDSLRWNGHDPSVLQPVSKLRLLGPCCADASCRELAYKNKGVNLIPSGEKGTAK